MKINGAWHIDVMPKSIIIEKKDGELKMVDLAPMRLIGAEDLQEYSGAHPRKLHGTPIPICFYDMYGFDRNESIMSEVVRVRMYPAEKEKLETFAENAGRTVSEFIRGYIREL